MYWTFPLFSFISSLSLFSFISSLYVRSKLSRISNLRAINGGEQSILASQTLKHPKYNAETSDFDFGIIKLSEPVAFSSTVYPICLPEKGYQSADQYVDRDALVTGWGRLQFGGQVASILQKVTVKTLSNIACQNTEYGADKTTITQRMICATNPGKDSCQGDSGGPLSVLINGANYFELVGLVSFGEGCAKPGYPGVYARVTGALSWIKQQVSGNTCPKPW